VANLEKFLGINGLYSKNQLNTYDIAKFIAISFMILDHLGFFLFPDNYVLRGLGRLAFPIFFFLIGYSNKFDIKWNFLIIGAVITIYRGLISGIWVPFDILITAFFVKILMNHLNKKDLLKDKEFISIFALSIIWHLALLLFMAYGTLGLLFAFCGFLKRQHNEGKPQQNLFLIITLTSFLSMFLQGIFWEHFNDTIEIFFVITVFLIFYLYNFKLVAIENIKFLRNFILFFSRNSLFIYWLHFVVLVYLSVILFPERYI